MSHLSKKKARQSTSSKKWQHQGPLPLVDEESSNGIRSAVGHPVLCLHYSEAVLTDEEIRDRLIDYICSEFVSVFRLLPVTKHPELIVHLYYGHCLGMLEPRSNIIVNLILHSGLGQQSGSRTKMHVTGNTTRSCLQKQYWIIPANQSLNGLLVFLMSYFRYLSKAQALRYLFLARCDLVLAIGLVESDIPNRAPFTFQTFQKSNGRSLRAIEALDLATIAAQHPFADNVSMFFALRFTSHNAERFSSIMKAGLPITDEDMELIRNTLLKPREEESCVTASSLRHKIFKAESLSSSVLDPLIWMPNVKAKELCDYSATVKSILLDALYGYYLKAFECLAPPLFYALQTSILRSGLCFGPSEDPVENILVNSIWFKNTYPELSPELRWDLVHSQRIAMLCRISLEANISFLCGKFSTLSSHDAILLLHEAYFDRHYASNLAAQKGHSGETDDHRATVHALQATGLPHCGPNIDMASFHSVHHAQARKRVTNLLRRNHHERDLNLSDLHDISKVLKEELRCSVHSSPSRVPVAQLSDKGKSILGRCKRDFSHKKGIIMTKLSGMLETHYLKLNRMKSDNVKQDRTMQEDPRVIVQILCIVGGQRHFFRGRAFFHVNILARRRDTLKTSPQYDLFFAQLWESRQYYPEFDYVDDLMLTFRSKDQSHTLATQILAWQKALTAGRCLPCESAVTKVIHPMEGSYCGKEKQDFAYCLDHVYKTCEGDSDSVFESDCIYFDDHNDVKLAKQLDGLDDEIFLPSD